MRGSHSNSVVDMTDRWIITSCKYRKHKSLEEAQTECARLANMFPKKQFTILRVKTLVNPSLSAAIINEKDAEIAALKRQLRGAA